MDSRTSSKVAAYLSLLVAFGWLSYSSFVLIGQEHNALFFILGLLFGFGSIAALLSLAFALGSAMSKERARDKPDGIWSQGSRARFVAVNLRIAFLWICVPVVVLAILKGQWAVDRSWLLLGGVVSLFGLVIRTRAILFRALNDGLLTTGPYGSIRHPRYVGTLLGYAGLCLSIRPSPWPLAVILALLIVHVAAALDEEQELRNRYGEVYERYKRTVPAWLPWRGFRPQGGRVFFRKALAADRVPLRLATTWFPGLVLFAVLYLLSVPE